MRLENIGNDNDGVIVTMAAAPVNTIRHHILTSMSAVALGLAWRRYGDGLAAVWSIVARWRRQFPPQLLL
jgi:hypothetical protein